MSLFLPYRRATLLVPSGTEAYPDKKHLFVVLTNPQRLGVGQDHILMVSISTLRPGIGCDETCILHEGDHPFIRHKSFVSYRNARIEEVSKILSGVKSGKLQPRDVMPDHVFALICKGLEESKFTAKKILEFYQLATAKNE